MNQTTDCYFCCYGKQVTMATERHFYISAVRKCRRPRFGTQVTIDLKSDFCVWLLGKLVALGPGSFLGPCYILGPGLFLGICLLFPKPRSSQSEIIKKTKMNKNRAEGRQKAWSLAILQASIHYGFGATGHCMFMFTK